MMTYSGPELHRVPLSVAALDLQIQSLVCNSEVCQLIQTVT